MSSFPEKKICCTCCDPTLDTPLPTVHLWEQAVTVVAPAPVVLVQPVMEKQQAVQTPQPVPTQPPVQPPSGGAQPGGEAQPYVDTVRLPAAAPTPEQS